MKVIWPETGKYIVAVSGGVDSVCLLDLLVAHGGYELVVAHVDHAVRDDSRQDLELTQQIAHSNSLYIVYTTYNFTKQASENELRQFRYSFLFEQMNKLGARAILTGHHADDLLETSVMNVRRGTDRYGAAGGMSREGVTRPLLNVHKNELIDYAQEHNLAWREDSTNTDLRYTRNQVRHDVIPNIDSDDYRRHLAELQGLNKKIDSKLKSLVSDSGGGITIRRSDLNELGLREVEVLIAYGLRLERPQIEISQPRIAQAARQIMIGARKISFSISATECIIIDIP